jgi:hypothetical protein
MMQESLGVQKPLRGLENLKTEGCVDWYRAELPEIFSYAEEQKTVKKEANVPAKHRRARKSNGSLRS